MRKSGAIAYTFAVILASSACDREQSVVEREGAPAESREMEGTTGEAAEGATVDVAALMESPDKYFGRTVTIVADVEEVLGPNAFTVDEDAALRGGVDNDMVVLSRKADTLADIDDQWLNNKVRVTGTVGRMNIVEIEREIGWDLDPELEAEVEKAGAVLIANSVERTQQ